MKKTELIKNILGFDPTTKQQKHKKIAKAYAPINFALVKYWGKENEELMIPKTDSLSISLGEGCGTTTKIEVGKVDSLIINNKKFLQNSKEYERLFNFINLFRTQDLKLKITSENNLPIASGFATSASAFASITLALNDFFQWNLNQHKLSILARFGSISASRSVYKNGFVHLKKDNGINAYSEQLPYKWENLYIGIIQFNNSQKEISSTDGMKQTVENSILYQQGWAKQVEHDIRNILLSIKDKNWELFQKTVQSNALAMHATAISAGVIYWGEETIKTIKKVLKLQKQGARICFTEDAGEHIKLISENKKVILNYFPNAKIFRLF